jgi:hypothetical protein
MWEIVKHALFYSKRRKQPSSLLLGLPTLSVQDSASLGGLDIGGSSFGCSIYSGSVIDISGPGISSLGSHGLSINVFSRSRKSLDLNKIEIQMFNHNDNSLFEDVLTIYLSADAKFKSAKFYNKNDFNFESL